jgi:hypothetical protein
LERIAVRDGLGGRSVAEAAWLSTRCEGLAAAELRDAGMSPDSAERWRAVLDALVRGFTVAPVLTDHGRPAAPPSDGATPCRPTRFERRRGEDGGRDR